MHKIKTTQLTRQVRAALVASAAALLAHGTALAAEQDKAAQEQAPVAAQSGQSTKASDDAAVLGNIVVTAQSRTQEAQAVPIPMQIVTRKEIEALAATDLSKLNGYIPGFSVDASQPTQPNYSLRGISPNDFGIGTDSPIGVYQDGVYTGKTGGALLLFNDIQRVEVLKGPQGTLFGRNSAGGAVSVTTNEPGDAFEAEARARVGNYGKRYVDGVLNMPISNTLSTRFTFVDNQSRGWLREADTGRLYGKDDDWGLRAQLRWNAPGSTKVLLSFEHEKLKQPPRPAISLVAMPADPSAAVPFPADPSTYLDPLHAPLHDDTVGAMERRTFDGATLRIEHPFGSINFTSITAWRKFTTSNREAYEGTNRIADYVDTLNAERNTSWSQEFKLAGQTGIADWVAGASYYRDNAYQTSGLGVYTNTLDSIFNNTGIVPGGLYGPVTDGLQAAGLPFDLRGRRWDESMYNHGVYTATAVYGDVIWHLSDRLNLTTGVRFTHDQKRFDWYNPPRVAPALDQQLDGMDALGLFDVIGVPRAAFEQNFYFTTLASMTAPIGISKSWSDTSPRLVLDYKFSKTLMAYVSATRGYQAGGFNALLPNSAYEPETVRNFEAGIKSYFPDLHLLFNASAYYYRFSNLQNLSLVADQNAGALPRYVVTTSDQEAKGLELEAHWRATDALRINATATYINQTYAKGTSTITDPMSGQPVTVNLSGQPTGLALWNAAAGIEYLVHGVAGGNLDFNLMAAYTGKTRCNSASNFQGACGVYNTFRTGTATTRTDARVAWSSPKLPWSFAFFVNNLLDKRYVTGVGNVTRDILGTPYASINAPRTWGFEAAYRF
ncbi:MAG: TonB-dependent receptor [Proteobacteria bacterium]|nr:TonB-dependent receptor [Pseudomonadota bacterium]